MNPEGSLRKRRFEGGWRGIAWILAALMVALMLAAAGCGDDDDDDAPADSGGGAADTSGGDAGGVATLEPGQEFRSVFIPKQTGIAVFEQANNGAKEAAQELEVEEAEFLGPSSPENCVSGQIDTVTNASTQGVNGIMISNCAGDQIEPVAQQAGEAGATVVSWDSPIPSGEGESVFIAQVDFDETGKVMADLALDILGEEGGEYAILSASADAANQNAWIAAMEEALQDPKYENLELVDTVYGNDDSEKSYDEALGLVDKHPNLKMIMAPTTVGIAAAGKDPTRDNGLRVLMGPFTVYDESNVEEG